MGCNNSNDNDNNQYGSIQNLTKSSTDPLAKMGDIPAPENIYRSQTVPVQIKNAFINLNRELSGTFYSPRVATNESVFILQRAQSESLKESVSKEPVSSLTPIHRELNEFKAGTNILNIFVGLGLLSQPYAIKQGGLISLIFLFIITMIASYTGKILVRCFKNMPSEMKSYPDIGFSAFNKFGLGQVFRIFSRIAIICDCGLALCVFIVVAWQDLIYISQINVQYEYIIIIMISAAMVPTVTLLTWNDLAFISLIGVISAIFLCIVIVINFFMNLDLVKLNYYGNKFQIFPEDFQSFSISFGIFLFTYGGHAFFAPIYDEMSSKAQENFEPMVDVTFFIMFVLHAIIAIGGYLPYCDGTNVLITQNLLSSNSTFAFILANIATAFVFLSAFCTVSPINSAICGTLEDWWKIYKNQKKRLFRVFVIILWCIISFLLRNKLGILEAIAGAITIMAVTYISPFMFYALIYKDKISKFNYYVLLVFAAICIVLAVFFTFLNIMAAKNPENNNS